MPPRPTPLLGFRPPFVKGGETVLPVLTGAGEWAELTASASLWAQIAAALAPAKSASPAGDIPVAAAPVGRPRGRRKPHIDPERYLAAAVDYRTGRWSNRRACAAAHELPSVAAWDAWRGKHRAEIEAALPPHWAGGTKDQGTNGPRAKAPLRKPSGRIL